MSIKDHTYEVKLVSIFSRLGPVIAIGKPNEALPELGAFREYIPESKWREHIIRRMEISQLHIFILGDSSGLREEITMSFNIFNKKEKLICFPSHYNTIERQQQYEQVINLIGDSFDMPKLSDPDRLTAIVFDCANTINPVYTSSSSSIISSNTVKMAEEAFKVLMQTRNYKKNQDRFKKSITS